MIEWFRKLMNGNNSDSREERKELDTRVLQAKQIKKIAEEDHQEAMELIRLLEREKKMNHYAVLVESALRNRRQDRPQ